MEELLKAVGVGWLIFVLPIAVWGVIEYAVCRFLKLRVLRWVLPASLGFCTLWCFGGIYFNIPFPQLLPPSEFLPAPWAALLLVGPAVLGVFLGWLLWYAKKKDVKK